MSDLDLFGMEALKDQLFYALLADKAASSPECLALLEELVTVNRILLNHQSGIISDEDAFAYVAVHGKTDEIRKEARDKFQRLTAGSNRFSAEQIEKLLKAAKELLNPSSES